MLHKRYIQYTLFQEGGDCVLVFVLSQTSKIAYRTITTLADSVSLVNSYDLSFLDTIKQ